MEIIQERLEREYQLDLITTAPSVIYRITRTDGTVEMIDNPTNYPDPSLIQMAEEPVTDAHIYAPKEYVGNIMELCQDRRGTLSICNILMPTVLIYTMYFRLRDNLRLFRHAQITHKRLCIIRL